MEEFWDGKPKEFMGYLIDHIYPNAYVPDLGIKCTHISYLNDQWESDIEVLTIDIKERAKVVFAPIYKNGMIHSDIYLSHGYKMKKLWEWIVGEYRLWKMRREDPYIYEEDE